MTTENALDNFPVPAVAGDEDGRRAIVDRDPGVCAAVAEVLDDIEVAVLHSCRERRAPVNHLRKDGGEGRVTMQLRGRAAREKRCVGGANAGGLVCIAQLSLTVLMSKVSRVSSLCRMLFTSLNSPSKHAV